MLNDTFEFRRFLVQTYKNKIDYFKDFFTFGERIPRIPKRYNTWGVFSLISVLGWVCFFAAKMQLYKCLYLLGDCRLPLYTILYVFHSPKVTI